MLAPPAARDSTARKCPQPSAYSTPRNISISFYVFVSRNNKALFSFNIYKSGLYHLTIWVLADARGPTSKKLFFPRILRCSLNWVMQPLLLSYVRKRKTVRNRKVFLHPPSISSALKSRQDAPSFLCM